MTNKVGEGLLVEATFERVPECSWGICPDPVGFEGRAFLAEGTAKAKAPWCELNVGVLLFSPASSQPSRKKH